MTESISNVAVAEGTGIRVRWLEHIIKFLREKPLGSAGAIIVLVFIMTGLLADYVAPYPPLKTNYAAMLQAPSASHWLGTDDFGRDILSRLIYASRTAMIIGLSSSFMEATLGLLIGVTSAYFGGMTDMIAQRILDVLLSFSLIILALAIVSIFGTGIMPVIFAITVPMVPRCARVVCSSALALRSVPYVDAARALGFKHSRIILCHMLPNTMAPYLIMLTAFMGQAIVLEAALSFLGLGVQEPVAAWGLMLQGGAESYAESAPWMPIFPGLAITLSVFAFNLFGDSLRDVLDPKLRI